MDARQAAAIPVRDAPSVRVESASDDGGDDNVLIEGVAYHSGLNRNAWGLTKEGAQQIADSLVGCDVTASHPPLRQNRYDRSVHGGQGAPIGEVATTEVVTADEAMLDDGEYTVRYIAEIQDPTAKERFESGLLTGDEYGVSVGIYGNPDDAECSVCRDQMAECEHDRFEEVEVEGDDATDGDTETVVAGPLYNDGESDHLASVFLPAYDNADASVASAVAGDSAAQTASTGTPPQMDALAASYGTRPDSASADAADSEPTDDATPTSESERVAASETTVTVDGDGSDTVVRF